MSSASGVHKREAHFAEYSSEAGPSPHDDEVMIIDPDDNVSHDGTIFQSRREVNLVNEDKFESWAADLVTEDESSAYSFSPDVANARDHYAWGPPTSPLPIIDDERDSQASPSVNGEDDQDRSTPLLLESREVLDSPASPTGDDDEVPILPSYSSISDESTLDSPASTFGDPYEDEETNCPPSAEAQEPDADTPYSSIFDSPDFARMRPYLPMLNSLNLISEGLMNAVTDVIVNLTQRQIRQWKIARPDDISEIRPQTDKSCQTESQNIVIKTYTSTSTQTAAEDRSQMTSLVVPEVLQHQESNILVPLVGWDIGKQGHIRPNCHVPKKYCELCGKPGYKSKSCPRCWRVWRQKVLHERRRR